MLGEAGQGLVAHPTSHSDQAAPARHPNVPPGGARRDTTAPQAPDGRAWGGCTDRAYFVPVVTPMVVDCSITDSSVVVSSATGDVRAA